MTENEISAMLKKTYGIEELYVPGYAAANEECRTVRMSPKLDIILSGGIPEGTWITFTGKPKVGKTTLALHYAMKCQQAEYGEREIYYLDIERRLKKMNLMGIKGLNLNKFHIIRSTEKRILSAQDFLYIAEHILRNIPNVVLIVDSYSMLTHSAELVSDVGTPVLGMGAYTLLAQFCRQMSSVVPVMRSNIVGITQQMANIGGMGHAPKTTEKGGTAIIYQGDVKLKAKQVQPWKIGSEGNQRQIGQIVTWYCEFSALGSPGQEIESFIRYGKGVDELYELIQCGLDLGLIEKKGSWYTLSFLPNSPKEQGGEGIYRLLSENNDAAIELERKVKGTLQ